MLLKLRLLYINKAPQQQVKDLLENNQVGTPGKSMVYQLRNVVDKLVNIPEPYYITLSIRDHLAGMACFSKRTVHSGDKSTSAFYIRYFLFFEKFRSGGIEKEYRKNSSKNSILRKEINELLEGAELPIIPPFLFYAYFDPDNIRSSRLIHEFGFKKIKLLNTIIFTRIFPKDDTRVIQIKKEEEGYILQLLINYYRSYQLVSFDNLFNVGSYFVLKAGDEIVAGIHAMNENWEIRDLPGLKGKILLKIAPHLPFIKHLVNPDYQFVSLDGIYVKDGYENELEHLISSVLNQCRVHTGIIILDPTTTLYQKIKSISPGIIHDILGEKQFEVAVKGIQKDYNEINLPVYISAFDVM